MTLISIFNISLPEDIPEFDLVILLATLVVVYLALLALRLLGVLKRRTCPSCSGKLTRKRRNVPDKFLTALTLNIMPFRRYKCIHCGWEGLRWSTKKHRAKDIY